MIREFSITNYKSILDLKLELGRINLFIGENGCGKTNILEAMAMAAAAVSDRLDTEELYLRGVRVAKPAITLSSFVGAKQKREIALGYTQSGKSRTELPGLNIRIGARSTNTASSEWVELRKLQGAPGWKLDREGALDFLGKQLSISDDGAVKDALGLVMKKLGSTQSNFDFITWIASASFRGQLGDFLIYNANQLALRGLMNISRKEPLGIHGENLDVAIASLGDQGLKELLERSALIRWVERIFTDPEDKLKFEGYKLGRSTSTLYFRDRFMRKRANIFSAENANEGILHALFYLTLFISDRTPKTFGIDNIETALNPRLCRNLIKQLAELAKSHDKQALITTHNPAALDGLDLHDDDQRLFVVARNDAGHTVASRIKLKPPVKGKEPRLMLSEMWMRGHLGGIPLEF
jgi:predicted ATPase